MCSLKDNTKTRKRLGGKRTLAKKEEYGNPKISWAVLNTRSVFTGKLMQNVLC